jgi:hypothetical protein
MGRKKAVELVPENQPSQVVDAKHTISFVAPYSVPNAPNTDDFLDIDEADDDDDSNEVEAEDVGPTVHAVLESSKASAEKLRKKLADAGLFQADGYMLTVEKFAAAIGNGIKTPRIPIATLELTEDELISQAYMETLIANGEGRYYLTLRWPTTGEIVKRWPVFVKPGDVPGQQTTAQAALSVAANPNSSLDEFERALLMIERINKLQAKSLPAVAPAPPPDPETALASYILKTPQGIKRLTQTMFGPQTESESLAVTLLQNAEPIGQMLMQVVSLVFANIANLKQNAAPVAMPANGFNPMIPTEPPAAINPTQMLSELLTVPLSSDNLTIQTFPPSVIASKIIETADQADSLRLPSIAHYVEMLARADGDSALSMLGMLARRPFIMTPAIESWLEALKAELQTYFEIEPDEISTAEIELPATEV